MHSSVEHLVTQLRAAPAWQRKREIEVVVGGLPTQAPLVDGQPVRLGDDAAAIATSDGYLLLAAEAVYPGLVDADPYLAGRSAILANVNDIYAMGGRPVAVVDTIVSPDTAAADDILRGLNDGCRRYGVALVGGHLTAAGETTSLTVCMLGRARRLLSSFAAQPGDALLHVTHLRGTFHPRFRFWDCSSHLPDAALRGDLALLPTIAEAGWCGAARDVSMAGLLGSLMMMLELSGVGAVVDLEAVPQPAEASERYVDWLLAFPSYGFVLAVHPRYVAPVQNAFAGRDLCCAVIGETTTDLRVKLRRPGQEAVLWDFANESFTGFAARATPS